MKKIETLGQTLEQSEFESFNEICKYKRCHSVADAAKISNYLSSPEAILQTVNNVKTLRYSKKIYLQGESFKNIGLKSLQSCLSNRRSNREYSRDPIGMLELSNVLRLALSTTKITAPSILPEERIFARAYPSGGGLYPIDIYIVGNNILDMNPFIAHYDHRDHSINLIKENCNKDQIKGAFMLRDETLERASAIIVFTGVFQRSTIKYGNRGYRLSVLEAGHAAQNVLLASESEGLGSSPWASFYDDEANQLLGVNGIDESILHAVLLGNKTESF